MLENGNYHFLTKLTPTPPESQDCVGVSTSECERVFSVNRKTALGRFPPIHTPTNRKPQDGSGITPPSCVRVGLQVGTVQYNTTQQIKNYQKN